MPKSRNRSRDIRKRAAKKRRQREKLARALSLLRKESDKLMEAGKMVPVQVEVTRSLSLEITKDE